MGNPVRCRYSPHTCCGQCRICAAHRCPRSRRRKCTRRCIARRRGRRSARSRTRHIGRHSRSPGRFPWPYRKGELHGSPRRWCIRHIVQPSCRNGRSVRRSRPRRCRADRSWCRRRHRSRPGSRPFHLAFLHCHLAFHRCHPASRPCRRRRCRPSRPCPHARSAIRARGVAFVRVTAGHNERDRE